MQEGHTTTQAIGELQDRSWLRSLEARTRRSDRTDTTKFSREELTNTSYDKRIMRRMTRDWQTLNLISDHKTISKDSFRVLDARTIRTERRATVRLLHNPFDKDYMMQEERKEEGRDKRDNRKATGWTERSGTKKKFIKKPSEHQKGKQHST